MLPNASFSDYVRTGDETGELREEDICALIAIGCGGPIATM